MKIYLMGLLSFFLTSFSAYASCCFVFPHNYSGPTNINQAPTAGDYNRQNPIFIPGDNGNYNSSSTSLPISVLRQLEENEREFRNELNRTIEKYNALGEKTKKEIEEELRIKIAPEPLPLRDYTPLGKDVEKARSEEAEKELARREAELEERARKSNAEAAELMRAQASYFKLESKEKVIEKTRHNLSSSSFAEYREAVGKLADLFDKYHELKAQGKTEHLAEIKSVLDQFVDDNGIINDFKPFFKQIENVQFKTNINQLESSLKFSYYTKIIKNINNSLGVLKNSYSPTSLEKAEIAIENSLKADALLAENRLDTANRYSNRASTSINFINNVSINIYARASRNTLSKDYFNISAVNGNTYENYSIIDISNRLARKLKTHYSDEAVLYGNLKLQEAEYQAANGDYRKFESNLDSVWQLYDALSSIGKGVAKGVYNFAAEPVESALHILLNPLSTVENIYAAIENHEHTYNLIVNSLREKADKYFNISSLPLEERSQLITETSLNLAMMFLSRGSAVPGIFANKVLNAAEIATAKTMERFAHIIPEGGYTPLVNGQYGLFKYEGNGGHTISRHVGLEQSLLKERAVRQGIPSVSSFTDLNVAERAVAEVLKENKTRIDEWLSTPPKPGERPFNLNSTKPSATSTGILYDLHSNTFLEVNNTRVAIVRDKNFAERYRILTSFPQR